MKIQWTPDALDDLNEIYEWIAKDRPSSAAKETKRIKSSIRRLIKYPYSGRVSAWLGIRELVVPYRPYIVVYSIGEKSIFIMAVVHAARDWKKRK